MIHFDVLPFLLFLLLNYPCTSTTTPTGAGVHNTIAISGSPACIINCSTYLNASVAFYFKHWTSNEAPDEIFDRRHVLNDYTSKYEVIMNMTASAQKETQDGVRRNSSNYFLNTRNAQEYHAGEYSCIDNDGIGDHLSATDLTVFDSTPRCNATTLISGSVSLRCEILFSGHAANVEILWSKTSNYIHEFLTGGNLTRLENSYVAEIDVHPDSSSSDSTYVIHIGNNNCQIQPNVCFQLGTELQVPRVTIDTTTYGFTDTNTSTCPGFVWNTVVISILSVIIGILIGILTDISIAYIKLKQVCKRRGDEKTNMVSGTRPEGSLLEDNQAERSSKT